MKISYMALYNKASRLFVLCGLGNLAKGWQGQS